MSHYRKVTTNWRRGWDVLNRFLEYGMTFNFDKCEFIQPQIKYLGHIINSNGIRPDPDKFLSDRFFFPRRKKKLFQKKNYNQCC